LDFATQQSMRYRLDVQFVAFALSIVQQLPVGFASRCGWRLIAALPACVGNQYDVRHYTRNFTRL
jgi:hypothetical protein